MDTVTRGQCFLFGVLFGSFISSSIVWLVSDGPLLTPSSRLVRFMTDGPVSNPSSRLLNTLKECADDPIRLGGTPRCIDASAKAERLRARPEYEKLMSNGELMSLSLASCYEDRARYGRTRTPHCLNVFAVAEYLRAERVYTQVLVTRLTECLDDPVRRALTPFCAEAALASRLLRAEYERNDPAAPPPRKPEAQP